MVERIDPRGFYLTEHSDGQHKFDEDLAAELARLCDLETVIDFGCGPGSYVSYLRERGIAARGLDGNPDVEKLGDGFRRRDLSRPVELPGADWILSLEVGEHIPADAAQMFLGNIASHARLGVVISWATPGSGGRGHVNERPEDWLEDWLARFGFYIAGEETRRLRAAARIPYYRDRLVVARRAVVIVQRVREVAFVGSWSWERLWRLIERPVGLRDF